MSDEGVKFDGNKNRLDLIPPELILGTGTVLTFGASKYGDRNWEKGLRWGRAYSAAMRHLIDWWNGEDNDPETGFSHLAHASANIAFLMAFENRGTGADDRPTTVTREAADRAYFENAAVPNTEARPIDDADRVDGWSEPRYAYAKEVATYDGRTDGPVAEAIKAAKQQAANVAPGNRRAVLQTETQLERGERLVRRWMMDCRVQTTEALHGWAMPAAWTEGDKDAASTYLVSTGQGWR